MNRNHAFLELCASANSSLNVDEPFNIGGMGTFGFVFVGDRRQSIPPKYPSAWEH